MVPGLPKKVGNGISDKLVPKASKDLAVCSRVSDANYFLLPNFIRPATYLPFRDASGPRAVANAVVAGVTPGPQTAPAAGGKNEVAAGIENRPGRAVRNRACKDIFVRILGTEVTTNLRNNILCLTQGRMRLLLLQQTIFDSMSLASLPPLASWLQSDCGFVTGVFVRSRDFVNGPGRAPSNRVS